MSAIPAPLSSTVRIAAVFVSCALAVLVAATWWLGITAALFAAIVLIGLANVSEKRLLSQTDLLQVDADTELDRVIALRHSLLQVARLQGQAPDALGNWFNSQRALLRLTKPWRSWNR